MRRTSERPTGIVSIPKEAAEVAAEYREKLLEKLSLLDDRFMERYLEGEAIDEAFVTRDDQEGDHRPRCVPVVCGSALRNKGIQPLLDAIVSYLPSPLDVPPVEGVNPATGETEHREARVDEDLCALAFKVLMEEGRKLVYIRVYSGRLAVGEDVYNVNLGKKEKVSRIYKIHANHKERVEEAHAGAIVGMVGLKETSTGHTLVRTRPIVLEPIGIYQPVISIAVEPRRNADQEKLLQVLNRIAEEDPTFLVADGRRRVSDHRLRHGRAPSRRHGAEDQGGVRHRPPRGQAAGRLQGDHRAPGRRGARYSRR